jgi:hypothetical protein
MAGLDPAIFARAWERHSLTPAARTPKLPVMAGLDPAIFAEAWERHSLTPAARTLRRERYAFVVLAAARAPTTRSETRYP